MKKLVVAGVLGLAVLTGWQGPASSMSLFPLGPVRGAPATSRSNAPVILAQSGDATMRVQQLEEEIRTLNGRVEEQSFQLLQMQEQIRKFQEDNEFRFQDLEKKPAPRKTGALETAPATDDVAKIIDTPPAGGAASGAQQSTLGAIELDANGKPIGSTINPARPPAANTGVATAAPTGRPPAQTPPASATAPQTASTGREDDSYKAAYGHVLSGDYQLAEKEFTGYIAAYPSGSKAADAHFWLGEAQYSQGKFNESAKTFLNAHQAYGKSPKAPEMLLKLGMSLAALDNKDTACATLREVPKRYPTASKAVLGKVTSEQKRLAC